MARASSWRTRFADRQLSGIRMRAAQLLSPQTPQRDRHFWRLANVLLRRRQGRDNIKIRRAIIARDGFVELAASYKPGSRLADIAGGDGVAALQASNATSGMTGDTIFIDAGPHNMG